MIEEAIAKLLIKLFGTQNIRIEAVNDTEKRAINLQAGRKKHESLSINNITSPTTHKTS